MRNRLVLPGVAVVLLGVGLPVVAAHEAHATPVRMEGAPGAVSVDGRDVGVPADCVTVRHIPHHLAVDNRSDRTVDVYLLPGCKGGVTHEVGPGRDARALGASVEVR